MLHLTSECKKTLYSQAHYPWNTRTPATFTRHIDHMVTYAGTSLIYILLLTAIVQFQMPQSEGQKATLIRLA